MVKQLHSTILGLEEAPFPNDPNPGLVSAQSVPEQDNYMTQGTVSTLE